MNTHKSRKKRLFLFAGYDANGVIDAAELLYVRALAALGDVVYVMDSDAAPDQISRVRKIPNVIYADARRHGEYDFGSYKRGFEYARDNGILGDYEFVYIVNDSVYGPLCDLEPLLIKMEELNTDAFGPVVHTDSVGTYIQSWFIGMRKSVFLSDWFDKFVQSIKRQPDKGTVIHIYERGFTTQLIKHRMSFGGIYSCPGRSIYNSVKKLYRRGLPFIKRGAFTRRHGALARQLLYVLGDVAPDTRGAILENAQRTIGMEKLNKLLTRNPLKIAYRNIAHAMRKVFIEGI